MKSIMLVLIMKGDVMDGNSGTCGHRTPGRRVLPIIA